MPTSQAQSPLPRGESRLIISGRSPGSWVSEGPAPSTPPSAFLDPWSSGFHEGRLPTYSGGTAPVFHRLPCYALGGTRVRFKCKWRITWSKLLSRSETRQPNGRDNTALARSLPLKSDHLSGRGKVRSAQLAVSGRFGVSGVDASDLTV